MATYVEIAKTTVGSGGTATISFTGIPGVYTDLCVKLSIRADVSGYREVFVNPNGSSANGSARVLQGGGAGSYPASYTASRFEVFGATNPSGSTSNTFSSIEFYIPNYAGSEYKSLSADGVGENNGATAYQELTASLWSSTSAITSLDIVLAAGANFVQYSTAYLYGIKKS